MANIPMIFRESFIYAVRVEFPSNYEIELFPVEGKPTSGKTGFRVIRFVVKYVFSQKDPDKSEFAFAKLIVPYTREEGKVTDLKIAKWIDGDWIEIGNANKVEFQNHLWGGYFEVEISGPNDPSIALGE